jgi:hypothetical protein
LVGGPYETEQAARSAAERTRDALLIWGVRFRFGVDVGDGHIRGTLTHAGKAHYEETLGKPVRNDVQGIDVYPDDGDIVFVRVDFKASVAKDVATFVAELRELLRSDTWQLSNKQRVGAELFCASFFDAVFRSRFITLVTAVEALLDPDPRSATVQGLIDGAVAAANLADLPNPDRDSLLGGLTRLRSESIGRAGRRLADALLAGRTYDALTPGAFFARCYRIRSQTVHTGAPEDPEVDFLALANVCQQFVGDLLLASLGLLPGSSP